MAWIESHTILLRHRKLIALAKALRLKPVYCLGHLHALWHVAMEQAEDGDLSSWTDEFVAESAGFQGDAPRFVSLLQTHGWLDGKILHDWLEYAGRFLHGKYSGKREKLVDIYAKHGRIYGETAKQPPSNRQVTAKLPPTTLPDLTIPNQTVQNKKQNKGCEVPEDLKASEPHILDWIAYKRERGQAYKPLGLNALWRTLRAISEGDREEAIRGSMANNYAGIFPPKGGSNGGNSREKPVVGDAKPVPGKYANFGQRITVDGVARGVVVDSRPQEGGS